MKKPQETAPRHPLCHGPAQSRPIAPPFRSLISSRHFATFSLSSSSQFRFSRPNLRSRCLILSISGGNLRERVTQRQALQFRIGEVVYNLIEINLKMSLLFCKLRFFSFFLRPVELYFSMMQSFDNTLFRYSNWKTKLFRTNNFNILNETSVHGNLLSKRWWLKIVIVDKNTRI